MSAHDQLKARFESLLNHQPSLTWEDVLPYLDDAAMAVYEKMESTGGEPTVIHFPETMGGLCLVDFSDESPKGRRSLCYDRKALESRKKNAPRSDAKTEAEAMGTVLLTEDEYRFLQELKPLDEKTSSWVATPQEVREKGGAIFCDRRFGRVFTYHHGAESYYASRGFRTKFLLTKKTPK